MIEFLQNKIDSAHSLISSLNSEKAMLQNELATLEKETFLPESKISPTFLYHELMTANTVISSLSSEKLTLRRQISAVRKEIDAEKQILEMELSSTHATTISLKSEISILQKQIKSIKKNQGFALKQVTELEDGTETLEKKNYEIAAPVKEKHIEQSGKIIELLKKEINSAHDTISTLASEKSLLEDQLFTSREGQPNHKRSIGINIENKKEQLDAQHKLNNSRNFNFFTSERKLIKNLLNEQEDEIKELREEVSKSLHTSENLNNKVLNVTKSLHCMKKKKTLMEHLVEKAHEDENDIKNIYVRMILDRDKRLSSLRNEINAFLMHTKAIEQDIDKIKEAIGKTKVKAELVDLELYRTIEIIKRYKTKKDRIHRLRLLSSFRRSCSDDTVKFLLEAISHNIKEAWTWEPILEPFMSDPSRILHMVTSNPNSVEGARETLNEELSTSPSNSRLRQDGFQGKYARVVGAHNRAISLYQLCEILQYIESLAENGKLPWEDRNPKSPTYGKQLTVKTVNLYHAKEFVIMEITRKYKCSMVEMFAKENQIPDWFVSHAWKMPVYEMVILLKNHAQVRGLDPKHTYYWICGYANNQHNVSQDISENPLNSSFAKALQKSKGVVLCLDTSGTPFQRIWCCFEQALAQHKNESYQNPLFDIATVVNEEPIVITDGRAAPVLADQACGTNRVLELKRDRESKFPLSLLEQGYEIDIHAAQATMKRDKKQIFKAIKELYGYEKDMAFKRVNMKLRGIFAEAAARKAAEERRLNHVVRVLRQDIERTKLILNLGGCSHLNLRALASISGHPSLQHLTIDCSYSHIVNMSRLGETFVGLNCLRKLLLNFSWCSNFQEEDITNFSIRGFPFLWSTLVELKMVFKGCNCTIFLPRMKEFKSLEKLFIDFSDTPMELEDGKYLGGILKLKSLRRLHLNFEGCQKITHIRPFKKLVQLQKLEVLILNFNYTNLMNVNELSALLEMESISECSISLLKCARISTIPWLTRLSAEKIKLKIDINLLGCINLNIPSLNVDLSHCNISDDSITHYFSYRWEHEENYEWKPFSLNNQSKLERAYKSGLKNLSISTERNTHEVDFRTMRETNLQHSYLKKSNVRRVEAIKFQLQLSKSSDR